MTDRCIYHYAGHGWTAWGWRIRMPDGSIVVRHGLGSYDEADADMRRWGG